MVMMPAAVRGRQGAQDAVGALRPRAGQADGAGSRANRLACECTTAVGIRVVPEEWVMAIGSSPCRR